MIKKLGKNGRTLLFRQFRVNLVLTKLDNVESRIWGYLIFQMIGIIYKVTNDLNNNVYIGQTVYLLENFLLKIQMEN